MRPWWERWPERLDYELEQLRDAGISFERDQKAFSRGSIVLRLSPIIEGDSIELVAEFPALFPYFRFEVTAPTLDLDHHQNPFSKNLCLIGRATENWDSSDTLAQFVRERVPQVIKVAHNGSAVEPDGLEQHQGEPFSDYYPYQPNSMVLIDSSWSIDSKVSEGQFHIGVEESAGVLLRGAVVKVNDSAGRPLAEAHPAVGHLYPQELRFRWIRLPQPLKENDASKFFDALVSRNPQLAAPWWRTMKDGRIDVIGILFPEEVRWRETGDGWVFLVRLQLRSKKGYKGERRYFARAGRGGLADLSARVPELAALSAQKVAQIGLGGIGGPTAIGLARSLIGELRILDYDYLDPGTSVRWLLGIKHAGFNKANLIENLVSHNWPYTKVKTYLHRIGAVHQGGNTDLELLDELLDGVDLIVDTTTEVGMHHLLSDLAAERRTPYLLTYTTPGAWGGLIARIVPGKTEGCWKCLQYARNDKAIPDPPSSPNGEVQPTGCADPTFTGTGFDVEQVAIGTVRLAVATLTAKQSGGYPNFDWDVAVIALRDPDGRPIAPSWQTFNLAKHPSCRCKGNAVSLGCLSR